MTGPRDTPANRVTGEPQLTDRQQAHLQAISEAADFLWEAMHAAEGSAMPGQYQEHHWQGRRMSIAATHLETAIMFARKAALE